MLNFISHYIVALIIFLVIDFFWLRIIAKKMYDAMIGSLLRDEFNLTAALIFYVFFIAGLTFFVILPADSWQFALLAGAFFGTLTYGTYDMTNSEQGEFIMQIKNLDGEKFYQGFSSGASLVEENRSYLNEINLFPVPDSDTGNNMSYTLNSTAARVSAHKLTP